MGFIPVVTSVGNILLLLRFCSSSRDYTVAIQNSLFAADREGCPIELGQHPYIPSVGRHQTGCCRMAL